jgi:PAS domain-containing protein
LRTLVLAAILATLLHAGGRRGLGGTQGWRAFVAGFGLILFGSVLNTLRGLPGLLPGPGAPLLDLLERVVGFVGGICLRAGGRWRWRPGAAATRANERELLRIKERYRAISAMTSDLNIDAEVLPDGSLRVDWISGSLHSDSGYANDAIMTFEQWRRVVLPEDRPLLENHLAAAGAGEPRRTELRVRTRDGRELWLALATPPRREPGSATAG